ncbi:AraC family transcriptional regulator [Ottowia testudinis]|uniref:AraC family transcriptional regulator n=1 Tax=Ottowia testudinis TaxID=2816950 RepID=A0A975CMD2_9BURK|nr:AraC family transcriptional regulator [Ottowia testudinis]QTD46138.1 AraC family transcriptional regulator [Ottowia testudinis]
MSAAAPLHHSTVLASPWPGLYGTVLDSARHFGRHWHATFGLGVMEGGAQRSASGRGPVEARAGDVITTNPGEVHDGRPMGDAGRRWRMVYIEPALLAELAELPRAQALEIARPVIQDTALRRATLLLLERLAQWGRAPAVDLMARLACEEALTHTTALLLRRHGTQPLPQDSQAPADLSRARARLADAGSDVPTLSELAASAGLSRFQLVRRFTRVYGVPPHAWLLLQRAERARGLIGRGLPLADAAAACGFADQSHMTRLFTRQFGFTPGAWQRAARRVQ